MDALAPTAEIPAATAGRTSVMRWNVVKRRHAKLVRRPKKRARRPRKPEKQRMKPARRPRKQTRHPAMRRNPLVRAAQAPKRRSVQHARLASARKRPAITVAAAAAMAGIIAAVKANRSVSTDKSKRIFAKPSCFPKGRLHKRRPFGVWVGYGKTETRFGNPAKDYKIENRGQFYYPIRLFLLSSG